MAKQKTIPELEAEKAENERKLSQLQHKKQQLENRITVTVKPATTEEPRQMPWLR